VQEVAPLLVRGINDKLFLLSRHGLRHSKTGLVTLVRPDVSTHPPGLPPQNIERVFFRNLLPWPELVAYAVSAEARKQLSFSPLFVEACISPLFLVENV